MLYNDTCICADQDESGSNSIVTTATLPQAAEEDNQGK